MIDASPLTVGQRQELFMECLGKLIAWAYASGYQMRGGELQRTAAEASTNAAQGDGIKNSLHVMQLAVDINLFRNGEWLNTLDAQRPVGAYWKSLHPLCCWGGDFHDAQGRPKPDADHYSVTYGGRK